MSQKIFGNDLVALCKSKVKLKLNKPVYVGMCIYDLSKVMMYGFYYEYITINMVKNQDYHSLIRVIWNDK